MYDLLAETTESAQAREQNVQDSLDKRKNLIFLTDKGKELQEALFGVVKQTIRSFFPLVCHLNILYEV